MHTECTNCRKIAKKAARWYVWHKGKTQDDVAKKFGITKTEVRKYFNELLPEISPRLAAKVKARAKKNSENALARLHGKNV